MRASTLTVSLASVVVLLSSVQVIAAGADAGKPGQRTKVKRSPASPSFKHNARSPQHPNVFVSYDYGYSYPPSPPTTYAEQLSSTATSLASGSEASYTKSSSVASITGTPGVSGSATTSSTGSTGSFVATVTVSDTVIIYPPNSTNGGLSISSGSSSITLTESLSTVTSGTWSSSATISTLWPPANTSSSSSSSAASVSTGSCCNFRKQYVKWLAKPRFQLLNNINGYLECIRYTDLHFDQCCGIFSRFFISHIGLANGYAVSIAKLDYRDYPPRDSVCYDDIRNKICYNSSNRNG
ncbi:hypothetical protein QIS74_12426 [Colletotrichum tabaci]|uniref:Uncharacterized protein n=1 Tax=Colletotrichum tabaci TaxID=1209068 RepID=A0AAV9SZP5_9PEZI